jgi:hypothetical protein
MSLVLLYWRTVLVLNIVIRPFLLNLGPVRGKLIVSLVTLYTIKNRISAIFKSVVWWEKSGSVVIVVRCIISRRYYIWRALRVGIAAWMWLSPQLLVPISFRELIMCALCLLHIGHVLMTSEVLGNWVRALNVFLVLSWYSLNAANKRYNLK